MKRHRLSVVAALAAGALMFTGGLAVAQQNQQGHNARQNQNNQHKQKAGQKQQGKKTAKGARPFLKQAGMIDLLEIRLGEMAQKKTSNPYVRNFARLMVDNHQRIQAYLKRLAQKKNANLPQKLDQKHKKMVQQLSKADARQFDRTYINHMVKGHTNAVKTFRKQAENGKDADVKAWAGETVIILKTHLSIAQQVQRQLQRRSQPSRQ